MCCHGSNRSVQLSTTCCSGRRLRAAAERATVRRTAVTTTGTDRRIRSLPAKVMLGAISLVCLAQCDQRSDQSLANACVAFNEELRSVQTCQSSDQCGQIFTG